MSKDTLRRLLLSLLAGTVAFFAAFSATGHYPMSFVWAWDAFALAYCAICVVLFLRFASRSVRCLALLIAFNTMSQIVDFHTS